MNEIERQAVAEHPVIQRILDLRDSGWRFIGVGPNGVAEVLLGARVWPGGWSDLLRVRTGTDSWAARTAHDGLVWQREGDLNAVLDELLALPAPGDPGAPRLVIGAGPSLWAP